MIENLRAACLPFLKDVSKFDAASALVGAALLIILIYPIFSQITYYWISISAIIFILFVYATSLFSVYNRLVLDAERQQKDKFYENSSRFLNVALMAMIGAVTGAYTLDANARRSASEQSTSGLALVEHGLPQIEVRIREFEQAVTTQYSSDHSNLSHFVDMFLRTANFDLNVLGRVASLAPTRKFGEVVTAYQALLETVQKNAQLLSRPVVEGGAPVANARKSLIEGIGRLKSVYCEKISGVTQDVAAAMRAHGHQGFHFHSIYCTGSGATSPFRWETLR